MRMNPCVTTPVTRIEYAWVRKSIGSKPRLKRATRYVIFRVQFILDTASSKFKIATYSDLRQRDVLTILLPRYFVPLWNCLIFRFTRFTALLRFPAFTRFAALPRLSTFPRFAALSRLSTFTRFAALPRFTTFTRFSALRSFLTFGWFIWLTSFPRLLRICLVNARFVWVV